MPLDLDVQSPIETFVLRVPLAPRDDRSRQLLVRAPPRQRWLDGLAAAVLVECVGDDRERCVQLSTAAAPLQVGGELAVVGGHDAASSASVAVTTRSNSPIARTHCESAVGS